MKAYSLIAIVRLRPATFSTRAVTLVTNSCTFVEFLNSAFIAASIGPRHRYLLHGPDPLQPKGDSREPCSCVLHLRTFKRRGRQREDYLSLRRILGCLTTRLPAGGQAD